MAKQITERYEALYRFESPKYEIDCITPEKRAVADQCFAFNKDVDNVYITSDLETFPNRSNAFSHAKGLFDGSVIWVKRYEDFFIAPATVQAVLEAAQNDPQPEYDSYTKGKTLKDHWNLNI